MHVKTEESSSEGVKIIMIIWFKFNALNTHTSEPPKLNREFQAFESSIWVPIAIIHMFSLHFVLLSNETNCWNSNEKYDIVYMHIYHFISSHALCAFDSSHRMKRMNIINTACARTSLHIISIFLSLPYTCHWQCAEMDPGYSCYFSSLSEARTHFPPQTTPFGAHSLEHPRCCYTTYDVFQ